MSEQRSLYGSVAIARVDNVIPMVGLQCDVPTIQEVAGEQDTEAVIHKHATEIRNLLHGIKRELYRLEAITNYGMTSEQTTGSKPNY